MTNTEQPQQPSEQQPLPPHRERAKLPANPQKAVKEFMNTMEELCTLYVEETEALSEARTTQFSALQSQKIEVGQKYEYQIRQMLERRDEFKDLPQQTKDDLTAQRERFRSVAKDNMKAMEQIQKSTQRLNDRIMSMARSQVSKDGINYTGRGAIENTERPISMGYNQSA